MQQVLQPQQRTVRGKAFIDPQSLMEALQFHQTLNMMGIERFRNDIRTITSGLEDRFEVPCPANLYVSYEGSSGGYGPHRDQHDVIVVHLYGEKMWNIYPARAGRPVAVRKINVSQAELQSEPTQVTMRAGSCLYIPAGFAHHVVSNEGCCVHLTFGIQVLRWYDVLNDILTEAGDDVLFERMPVGEEATASAFRERIVQTLSRTFSEEAVQRMVEQYQYFSTLARHEQRVVKSVIAPSKSTDR